MARIRTIKPEFYTDGVMVQLPMAARLFFVGTWSFADDHGRFAAEPDRLKMQIFPSDDVDVDELLDLLVVSGRIELYEAPDGRRFFQIVNWDRHQRVDHPGRSQFPREGSRKIAIPQAERRALAQKYECPPGESREAACFYCGAPGTIHWHRRSDGKPSYWVTFSRLEIDHVEAEDNGGQGVAANLVLACQECNRRKATSDPVAFLLARNGVKHANLREDSRGLAPEGKGREREMEREDSPLSPPTPSSPSSHPPGRAVARRRDGKSKGLPAPWLGVLRPIWRKHYGGDLPKGAADLLRPVVAEIGETELALRLERYCATTPAQFVNLGKFAAVHGSYAVNGAPGLTAAKQLYDQLVKLDICGIDRDLAKARLANAVELQEVPRDEARWLWRLLQGEVDGRLVRTAPESVAVAHLETVLARNPRPAEAPDA